MTAVLAPPPNMGRHPSESNSSPGDSPSGFTAVNGKDLQSTGFHGKNGYDSSRPSSQHAQHAKPQSEYDRDGEGSSPTLSHSQASSESGNHKRKRSQTDETTGYSPVSRYDYSPPKRLDHTQNVAERAMRALERTSPPTHHQSTVQNGHSWNSPNSLQPTGYEVNGNRHDTSDSHLAEALQRATQDGTQSMSNWSARDGEQDEEDRLGYSQENTPQAPGTGGQKRKRNFSNRTKTGCMTCRRRKKKCDEQHPKCNNCARGGFECGGYSNQRETYKPTVVKPPVALVSKEGYKESPAEATYKQEMTPPKPVEGGQMRPITIDDNDSSNTQFTSSPQSTEPRSRPAYWPQQGQQQHVYGQEHATPVSEVPRHEHTRSDHNVNHGRREQARAVHVQTSPQHPAPQQQQQAPQPPPQHQHPQYPGAPPPNPPQGQWQPAPQPQTQPSYPPPQSQPSYTTPQAQPSYPITPQSQQPSYPPPPPPQSSYQPPPSAYPPPQQSYVPPSRMDTTPTTSHSHSHSHSQPPSRMSTGNTTTGGSGSAQQSGPRTFTAQEVEKSKMLRGAFFNFLDPTLENERARCDEALDRYNSACKLRNAAEPSHRDKLLEKVFDPSKDTLHHPIVPCKEKGSVGHRVKIEAPFTCTYGYNITIREDVFVGKNCNIDDAAVVDIGSRSWIGPGVTIITTDVSKEMVDRKGWESKWCAKGVYIGNEVVVGAGAVIYPGVHLARGSTVEPFAIVKHSLYENQVQQAIFAPRH